MREVGWLKQSLLEARRETADLPEWAREMLRTWDAHYGPGSTSTARTASEHAVGTQPPDTADASAT
jgi:hypothetical protein